MGNKESMFLQEVEAMLTELNMALKGFQIYPDGHPALRNITVKTSRLLVNLSEQDDLNIGLIGNDLVANGSPFLKASGVIENFKQEMARRKIEGISFIKGLNEEDVRNFIEAFSTNNWREELEKRKISNVRVGKISAAIRPPAEEVSQSEKAFQKVYQENLDRTKKIIEDVETIKTVKSEEVNSTVKDILDSLLKDKSAFLNLNRIKNYDNYTFAHCVDVCMLSLIQGESLNFPKDKLLDLGVAAFLHDLGKVSIPKQILNKPAKLTSAEEVIIREHPIRGAKILQQTEGITPLAAIVAFEHHIYYNLQGGYPQIKQERKLNIFTMIVSIADFYDALTTLRPYRQPFLPYQTLALISKLAGTQFEPFLVRNFMRLLGPYPIGSFVRLNTNELGFIGRLNPGTYPWIKIVFDAQGSKLKNFLMVDLSSQTERKIVSYDNPLFKGITAEEVLNSNITSPTQ